MKIVVFGPHRRVGALDGDRVIDLNQAYARYLRERRDAPNPQAQADEVVPADLERFITLGARALDAAREALAHVGGNGPEVQLRSSVKLHAPSIYRPRIACAGGNYALHSAGAQEARTGQKADVDEVYRQSRAAGPWGFWKINAVLAGDGDDVIYPARASVFDYEGEAVVVVGKQASDIPAARASEVIWGVTLLNDWSIRNDMGPNRVLNFNLPKNFDTSVSVGPCIAVGEVDPQDILVETRVNRQVRQHYRTSEMTFSFAEFLEFLSRDFTFLPGDLLAGGTGAGTAMDSSRGGSTELFLKVGDTVEVSSPEIGTLNNRVVAKGAAVGAASLAAAAR
jgi:2-keto-4-pentenoate hydratase/2-oxohepta-3-ene-1,7-dioic acid hydratase in catechol pathway